jgi:NRPS condensation-like uncharacterized protein
VTRPPFPARAGRTPGRQGRVPFSAMDEYSRHLLQEHLDADTVHLEAHLPGAVDIDRLRHAFVRTMAAHPGLQVRQSDARWWHRRHHWELAPLTPAAVARTADLGHTRHRALTDPPLLSCGPPLRLETAPVPGGGTAVLLTAAHTLADGGTCLRLLCDLADRYSGASPGGSAAFPPRADRYSPPGPLSPRGGRPARIAPSRKDDPAPDRGTGVHLGVLPLTGVSPHLPHSTVNDVLLTAVQLTLSEWNHRHGRPTGPIHLSMPVDDRPHGPLAPGAPMGNHNHLATIRAEAPLPGPEGAAILLNRITAQTRAAKAAPAGSGLVAALVSTPWLPIGAKGPLTRALRRAAAPWTSTALVSNLGRVTHPLDFGSAGRTRALWFSAPVRMPRGLSVSALTLDDRFHLSIRHCHRLLDAPAAAEIAQRCAETLDTLTAAGRRR